MPTFSIYTPSHNPQYLDDCYQSLCDQTFKDWEWLVGLNNNAEWNYPLSDSRIHVGRINGNGIGALKAELCSAAVGDYLVELDHDDLLHPECLYRLHAAFIAGAQFVYSDTAQMNADGTRNEDRFAEGHGWVYYDDPDSDLMAFESKPDTPHNVSYIWYAPNHVRAFTRQLYIDSGGYDPELTVCDDADLMCRMYQLTDFTRIPLCLYYQRLGDNTQRNPETNALIQSETVRIYDENIQKNAIAWSIRNGLPRIDLGGAHNCPNEYIPFDREIDGKDILVALDGLDDNSIGIVRAVDFIEHIADKITLMNEIYRVLAPGGMLLTLTPSTDGRGAFCDPTHVSFWNELSFRYYCDPEYQKYVPAITARFRQSRLFTDFPSEWHQQLNLPYVCFNGTKDP